MDNNLKQLQNLSKQKLETLTLEFVQSAYNVAGSGVPAVLNLNSRSIPLRVARANKRVSHLKSITMITSVMAILHKNLSTQSSSPSFMTRRDVYYQDPILFGSQNAVDKIISLLVDTIPPPKAHKDDKGLKDSSHLGVIASPRGVVLGSVRIHLHNLGSAQPSHNHILDARIPGSMGVLIPPISRICQLQVYENVKWILVVEKDATFQHLALLDFCQKACPKGIMVTSKGFPDLASRQFLAQLSTQLPIYILTDGDPFGAHIYWVYYQAILYNNHCANTVPKRIAHIGVHLSDLQYYGIDHTMVSMPLLTVDVKRLQYLLRNPEVCQDWVLCRSLQIMFHTYTKIEIQALGNELCTFLGDKLSAFVDKVTTVNDRLLA